MVDPIGRNHVPPRWNEAWENYWHDVPVAGVDGMPINTQHLSAKAPSAQVEKPLPHSYDTIEQHPANRVDRPVDTNLTASLPPPRLENPSHPIVSAEKIAAELEKLMRDVKNVNMDPLILRMIYKFLELQRALKEESNIMTMAQLQKDQENQKGVHKDQMEAHERMHEAARKVKYARWIEKAIYGVMMLGSFISAILTAGAAAPAVAAAAQSVMLNVSRISMIAQLSNMAGKRYFDKKNDEHNSELFDKREQAQELKRKIESKVRGLTKTWGDILDSYKIQAKLEKSRREAVSALNR